MKLKLTGCIICGVASVIAPPEKAFAQTVLGEASMSCAEDPACMNRLHPEVPMIAEADQGEPIVFVARDAFDLTLDPDVTSVASRRPREGVGIAHAFTGPVHIRGAKAGEVVAITIEALEPASVGWTDVTAFGFGGDHFAT